MDCGTPGKHRRRIARDHHEGLSGLQHLSGQFHQFPGRGRFGGGAGTLRNEFQPDLRGRPQLSPGRSRPGDRLLRVHVRLFDPGVGPEPGRYLRSARQDGVLPNPARTNRVYRQRRLRGRASERIAELSTVRPLHQLQLLPAVGRGRRHPRRRSDASRRPGACRCRLVSLASAPAHRRGHFGLYQWQ